MIVTHTFSDTHYASLAGGRLKKRAALREQATQFTGSQLGDEQIVGVTGSEDEYVSSVTVWYRAGSASFHPGRIS